MTAPELLAIADDAAERALHYQGLADQARLRGYIPVPTTTRDIRLPLKA